MKIRSCLAQGVALLLAGAPMSSPAGARPARFSDFVTSSGTPRAPQGEDCIAMICVGKVADDIRSWMGGSPSERYAGSSGGKVESWDVRGFRVTVETDIYNAVTAVTAARIAGSKTLIGVPGGIVLGRDGFATLVKRLGRPTFTTCSYAEAVMLFDYGYATGAEASVFNSYGGSDETLRRKALGQRVTPFSIRTAKIEFVTIGYEADREAWESTCSAPVV